MKIKNIFIVTIIAVMISVSPAMVTSAEALRSTFTPRISVSEEYTDNIFLEDTDTEDDYITLISPGISMQFTEGAGSLELSYNPSYAWYKEFDENNTWRHDARMIGQVDISKRTELEIRNTFVKTEDPVSRRDLETLEPVDPSLPADTTIRESRREYYRNNARIQVTHQFSPSDSLRMGYAHSLLENDDPLLNDMIRHRPFMGLTYRLSPLWDLSVDGDYVQNDNDKSEDLEKWDGRATLIHKIKPHIDGHYSYGHTHVIGISDIYRPSVGFVYSPSKDLSLKLDVGYFVEERDEGDDDSGVSADVELTKRLRRGSIQVTGASGYDASYYDAENLGSSSFYSVGAAMNYQIYRNIGCRIFASYRNDEYQERATDREDDMTRAGFNLNAELKKGVTTALGYTYRQLDSDVNIEDYEENRVNFSISLTPARPIKGP